MKKIFLLPVITTHHRQRPGPVNAKTSIATLLFFALITPVVFSQTVCDTLIAKDGRQFAVAIVRTNSEGLFYTKCSETTGQQYFMSSAKILELRKPGGAAPVKIAPPPASKPLKEKYVPQRDETDLSKPKTIIWAGLAPLGLATIDVDVNGRGYFLFGAEMGFKNVPLRLGVILHPIFLRSDSYYTNVKEDGVSGEIGLVLKKFTQGRLSGNVSKAYWGIDLRTGRQEYSYSVDYGSGQETHRKKYSWTSVMPCIGFQFYYEMLAFDLALPIGYQFYHSSNSGGLYNSDYSGGTLALQPSLSIGFRF